MLMLETGWARGEEGSKMKAGDRIVVGSAHAGERERTGEILEVVEAEGRFHYRIRWSDGHASLFFPGAGIPIRVLSEKGKERATTGR